MKVKKTGFIFLCAFLLCFGAAIIVYPERYVNCCFAGFVTWAECVLPSLFPFMIISMILIKTGAADRASLPLSRAAKKLNLPQNAAVCFLLSICSGYPAGSRFLAEYKTSGALSETDLKKLAPLCSTSGPLFIIGSIGFKTLGDKALGGKIFLAHAASVILLSLIFCRFYRGERENGERALAKSGGNILYDTFYSAIISVAVAGGFIAFFFTAAQFLSDFNALYPLKCALSPIFGEAGAEAFCLGLIEATGGCRALAAANSPFCAPASGFLITFGGASILAQQLCYLAPAGVKPLNFILQKALQGGLCFVILLLIT